MSFKPRKKTVRYLWVRDARAQKTVHAAEVVGRGGSWDIDALCGAEFERSQLPPAGLKSCADCVKRLRRRPHWKLWRPGRGRPPIDPRVVEAKPPRRKRAPCARKTETPRRKPAKRRAGRSR